MNRDRGAKDTPKEPVQPAEVARPVEKQLYIAPVLKHLGSVRELTLSSHTAR